MLASSSEYGSASAHTVEIEILPPGDSTSPPAREVFDALLRKMAERGGLHLHALNRLWRWRRGRGGGGQGQEKPDGPHGLSELHL